MIRSKNEIQTTLANQETVRFYLKPYASGSGSGSSSGSSYNNSCMYDLDRDESDTTNSGLSLNEAPLDGLLNMTYTWSTDFLYNIRQELYDSILPVLNLDVVNTVNKVSKTAKDTAKIIFDNTTQLQKLRACPSIELGCRDPYILQKIVNRYNYDMHPPYPTQSVYNVNAQYGAQQRVITEIRRAGIASPTSCHVELLEDVITYDDMLYESKPENRRRFINKYKFDILGTCENLSIGPISKSDVQSGKLDIKGDPYGIDSEKSVVNPLGQEIISPLEGSSGGSSNRQFPKFTYNSPKINCVEPRILDKVRLSYERCDVSSKNVSTYKPAFNKIIQVLEWFNPAPNICEYKMNIQHVYFDIDYGYYYSVPDANPITGVAPYIFESATFGSGDQPSYIVAKWVPDEDYDIESGIVKRNRPIVDEYFYPDLSLREGKFYRNATSTTPLNLPYLSGVGLSARGSSNPNGVDYVNQLPRFSTENIPSIPVQTQNTPNIPSATWTKCDNTQTISPLCRYEDFADQPVAWPPKTCAP
jgi:hypothetical protein